MPAHSPRRDRHMKPQARKTGVVVEEIDAEVLVYDLGRDEAHCLKQVTALVWRLADGLTPIDTLIERVRLGSASTVIEDDVWCALESLSAADLLIAPVERPVSANVQSRRDE
jgi:hypothetical protein